MSRSSFSHADAWIWTLALTSSLIGALTLVHAVSKQEPALWLGAAIEIVLYVAASVFVARGGGPDAGRNTLQRPGHDTLRDRLGLRSAPLWLLVSALLLGIFVHSLTDQMQALVERVIPTPEAVLRERLDRLSAATLPERLGIAAFVCVLAPLAEELFFRGALYARLALPTRSPIRVGLTIACCFTVSHADPRIWPALLLVAFSLGLVRAASQSLAPCFLLHAAFNATTLILVWTEPNPEQQSSPAWPLVFASSLLALGLLGRVAIAARAEAARR